MAVDAYDLHRVLPQLPWKDVSAVPPSLCLPKQVIEGVTGILVYLTGNILQRLSHIDILDFVVLPYRGAGKEIPRRSTCYCHYHNTRQQDFPLLFQENRPLSGSIIRGPPWTCQGGTQIFPKLFLTYVQNCI
jgi:hypothetical protein